MSGSRYASSASIAATILEEGSNSPADVVFMQDAGALGALAIEGFLAVLPDRFLSKVDPRFRSPSGEWVGTSGRARTVVYNVENIDPETDLPEFDPRFRRPDVEGAHRLSSDERLLPGVHHGPACPDRRGGHPRLARGHQGQRPQVLHQ